jgi:hypothetical protein
MNQNGIGFFGALGNLNQVVPYRRRLEDPVKRTEWTVLDRPR